MTDTNKTTVAAIPSGAPFAKLVIKVPNAKATPPARPGSLRFKRWAILLGMSGQTVSQYYKACREAGMPCTANNPRDAHAKGLINLTMPPKEAAKVDAKGKAKVDKATK